MLDQVGALTEGPFAVGTFKGPVARMDAPVPDQSGAPTESFVTVRALVRLLPVVQPLVAHVFLPASEGGLTRGARVRLFSSVDSLVPNKFLFVSETFITAGTLVDLFPGVASLVPGELLLETEALLALGTLVRPVPDMGSLVPHKFLLIPEAFFTLGAFVGPLNRVGLQVPRQLLLESEVLLAGSTFVGPLCPVDPLVPRDLLLVPEDFLALGALVDLLSDMSFLVPGVFVHVSEALVALAALEGPFLLGDTLTEVERRTMRTCAGLRAQVALPIHNSRWALDVAAFTLGTDLCRLNCACHRGDSASRTGWEAFLALGADQQHLLMLGIGLRNRDLHWPESASRSAWMLHVKFQGSFPLIYHSTIWPPELSHPWRHCGHPMESRGAKVSF